MKACYYGSVNRWECDENDHLNVRFYAQKVYQAVDIFLREDGGESGDPVRVQTQHIRFLAEARTAAPLRVDCGLLSARGDAWDVLALMVNLPSEQPVAGFVTRVHRRGLGGLTLPEIVEAPDWARPRGLDPADGYPAPADLDSAFGAGFQTMGRGVIGADECDAGGVLLPHIYIGRLSDGMPNLWAFTSDEQTASARGAGQHGGAALEYRLSVLRGLKSGDVFRHVSGIRAVGRKTQHMVHLLWNESLNTLAATAEAIGVAMDLSSRRAVPISDDRRRRLERLLLR